MRKILLLVLICVLAMSGCTKKDQIVINVYNWGDYIDESVIGMFEEKTGIKVNYEMFDTNEIMYQKVKTGGSSYDVVFPSDYMIEKMVSENLVQKIDFNNIPNYKYIEDKFKNLGYDPNNQYSVPYMWGTIGIVYNKDMVTEDVDSWNILWDKKYDQNIIMVDSVRDAFMVALKKLGFSANSTNMNELEAAKNELITQKPLVLAYVVDEVKDKMIGNEAALAVMWSGDAINVMDENEALDYVIPKEGGNIWVDGMAIPTSSNHKKEAEMFIDFMCDPEIAFKNADYIGYSSPNSGAKEKMDEETLNNKGAYPDQDVLDKCEVFVDLKDATKIYDDLWNEVKAAN